MSFLSWFMSIIASICYLIQQDWLWAMVQTITIVISLVVIGIQLRIQTGSHIVTSIQTIEERWNSEPMLRARNTVCRRWQDGKKDFDPLAEQISEFFEDLGVYARNHVLSSQVLWEVFSWNIQHYYCLFSDGIRDKRNEFHDDTLYDQFEHLFNRLNRINRKKISEYSRANVMNSFKYSIKKQLYSLVKKQVPHPLRLQISRATKDDEEMDFFVKREIEITDTALGKKPEKRARNSVKVQNGNPKID
ncbi:MAG: hypothetical protein AB1894_27655 [Chloroflexota bacterium]